MIKIKNITKIYQSAKGKKVIALDNVSVNIGLTGMTFIAGKSGAGKTTLLNIIGGLDRCNSGDVEVLDFSVSKFTEEEITNYRNFIVGFIFQEFNLLEDCTVWENIYQSIQILPEKCEHYTVEEVLKLVDILELKDRFINELSGGQKQRVAIARALVKKPKILLCDEPTGSLDFETRVQIIKILKDISKQIAVIVISHYLEDVQQYGDRIIILEKGKIQQDITQQDCTTDKTENKINNIMQLKKVKKKIKFKDFFKISFRFLKVKYSRLFFIIPLFLICLLIFNIILSPTISTQGSVFKSAMEDHNIDFVILQKLHLENIIDGDREYFKRKPAKANENDYLYLQDYLQTEVDIIYDMSKFHRYPNIGSGGYELTTPSTSDINYYSGNCHSAIEINQKFLNRYGFKLDGRLPKSNDEVVITEYIFELYQFTNYKDENGTEIEIKDHNDLIGKKLIFSSMLDTKDLPSFTIVGILDTKFNSKRYKPLADKLNDYSDYEVLRKELHVLLSDGNKGTWLGYNLGAVHNALYVNDGYFDVKNSNDDSEIVYKASLTSPSKPNNDRMAFMHYKEKNDAEDVIFYPFKEIEEAEYEVYTPIPFDINSKSIREEINNKIKEYAETTYSEIRAQWIADGRVDTTQAYYAYICDKEINEYDKEHSYKYFEEYVIYSEIYREPIETELVLNIGSNKLNVQHGGYYYDPNSTNSDRCYCSQNLYTKFLNIIEYDFYEYFSFMVPLSEFETKYFDMREENITDIEFLEENKLLPNKNNDYIVNGEKIVGIGYDIVNEITVSFEYLKTHIEVILTVFKIILPFLVIILILLIYDYFRNVIIEKRKEIGIYRLLGYQKKEIFVIFFYQILMILLPVLAINNILCVIVIKQINNYFDKIYFALYPVTNLGWSAILITIILTFSLSLLGISLPLYRILRKTPIQIINNK